MLNFYLGHITSLFKAELPTIISQEMKKLSEEKSSNKKIAKKTEDPIPTFPAEGFVNPWGFIRLNSKVAEAFGAIKGQKTPITIDLQEGALVIKKV